MRFNDRDDAGRQLAERLSALPLHEPVVVALPRGGVPVAYPVARRLRAALDVIVARTLGAPGDPSLGIGAIAQGGAWFLNAGLIARLGVTREYLRQITRAERVEIDAQLRAYRGDRTPLDARGRTAVLVDDGSSPAVLVRAAVRALREQGARAIVFAAPVCAMEAAQAIEPEVDELVCLECPADLGEVAGWYRAFDDASDDAVGDVLERAARDAEGYGHRGASRSVAPPAEPSDERAV